MKNMFEMKACQCDDFGLFIFMLILEVGSQSFVVLKKMRAEFRSQSPNVCQWYHDFLLSKSSCLPSLIQSQDQSIVMFSEILILIMVSRSTKKKKSLLFFFPMKRTPPFSCIPVHSDCKIKQLWERINVLMYQCWLLLPMHKPKNSVLFEHLFTDN